MQLNTPSSFAFISAIDSAILWHDPQHSSQQHFEHLLLFSSPISAHRVFLGRSFVLWHIARLWVPRRMKLHAVKKAGRISARLISSKAVPVRKHSHCCSSLNNKYFFLQLLAFTCCFHCSIISYHLIHSLLLTPTLHKKNITLNDYRWHGLAFIKQMQLHISLHLSTVKPIFFWLQSHM